MIFNGKPASRITADDLKGVIGLKEGLYVDFKQAPYPQTSTGTKELIKDVTALANAQGGYILIGIEEDGKSQAVTFRTVANADEVRWSIIDRCMARIQDRLTDLSIAVVNVDGAEIIVVHVPESYRKPHCALPDAEHHYFWRRYEDGNKLMTVPEIRQCLEGDRLLREVTETHEEMSELRRLPTAEYERSLPEGEEVLLDIRSPEEFFRRAEKTFLDEVGGEAYYRLTATPVPLRSVSVMEHRHALLPLLEHPPALGRSGWDMEHLGQVRTEPLGFVVDRREDRHLRLLRNGHLEFWANAGQNLFRFDGFKSADPQLQFLYPCAVVEFVANFVLLVQQLANILRFSGDVEFSVGLFNAQGVYLPPYAPGTNGYRISRHLVGQAFGAECFGKEHLRVPPVRVSCASLPDKVVWRLVSEVYYQFNYSDDQIPYFDSDHNYVPIS